MKRDDLVAALSESLPPELAADLIDNFLVLRQDVMTLTLGRAAPGKFIETFVQTLQYLETGTYDESPNVDVYLRNLESRSTNLPDGLRICGARVARSMYTLRNKRNILHKGDIDPNRYDLRFLHHAAQWVLAELIRSVSGQPMEMCGRLVEVVQAPVGGLVEDFGNRRIVLHDMATAEEILVLLHSYYPDALLLRDLKSSVDRRHEETVRNSVRKLWKSRLVEGDSKTGYRLTQRGFEAAMEIVRRHIMA